MKNLKVKIAILVGITAGCAFGTYKLVKFLTFKKKEKQSHLNTAEVYDQSEFETPEN